jgi:hypothetical protein
MEIAGGTSLIDVIGSTPAAGIFVPNAIHFDGMNATASGYFGVRITRGINIWFSDSWLGDVIGGSTVSIIGASAASDIDTVNLTNTVVGAAAESGIYAANATNLLINNCTIAGNSLSSSGTYNAVYCAPNMLGVFRMTDSQATNAVVHNLAGAVAYGLLLDTGSFTGGRVIVTGNQTTGLSGGILDASAPTGTAKVVANNTTT